MLFPHVYNTSVLASHLSGVYRKSLHGVVCCEPEVCCPARCEGEGCHLGMPEVEESRRGVVEPLWVRDPRDREGGSWGGEKRSSCCRFSGVTFARGSVDGDMLGRRDCTTCTAQGSLGCRN